MHWMLLLVYVRLKTKPASSELKAGYVAREQLLAFVKILKLLTSRD